MKTFAIDQDPIDIEELSKVKCRNDEKKTCSQKSKCCSANNTCNKTCSTNVDKKVHIVNATDEWYAPKTMDDLYGLLSEYKAAKYRFVGGNTGEGVYKNEGPFDVYIDIKNVPDLFAITKTAMELTVGAGITLTKLIEILNLYSAQSGFEYLSVIAIHIGKIAVRMSF